MKLVSVLVLLLSVYSLAYSNIVNDPKFNWLFLSHDFGKVKKGIPVTIDFNFTNVGKVPLIISDSKAGCECTTAKFAKTPVAPGQTSHIQVTYNAASIGKFEKAISVSSNASELPEQLTISGEVVQ